MPGEQYFDTDINQYAATTYMGFGNTEASLRQKEHCVKCCRKDLSVADNSITQRLSS